MWGRTFEVNKRYIKGKIRRIIPNNSNFKYIFCAILGGHKEVAGHVQMPRRVWIL